MIVLMYFKEIKLTIHITIIFTSRFNQQNKKD